LSRKEPLSESLFRDKTDAPQNEEGLLEGNKKSFLLAFAFKKS